MPAIERALRKLRKEGSGSDKSGNTVARLRKIRDPAKSGSQESLRKSAERQIEFDLQALNDSGILSLGNQQIADEYRQIKQPILRKAGEAAEDPEGVQNLLMVSSSLAGEGKTFTSVNLALSLAAEQDWEVLLIDTDCKNPQLSRLLGVSKEPGLLDLLKNPDMEPHSLILGTNIDGLSVLPVGQPDSHSPELIASARMAALCKQFSGYGSRRVVTMFDSSPLLLTPEPRILSGYVGQVVLVVRADQTPRQAVQQAVEKIDTSPAIGLVFNGADGNEEAIAYGTYQAYGTAYRRAS